MEAGSGWRLMRLWASEVIASSGCILHVGIYLLSSVPYSSRCYASLNSICTTKDYFSPSCASHLCRSPWPSSFRNCLFCDLMVVLAATHEEQVVQSGVLWKEVLSFHISKGLVVSDYWEGFSWLQPLAGKNSDLGKHQGRFKEESGNLFQWRQNKCVCVNSF